MRPAVVVNTFDRPESLSRLLRSLEVVDAPAGTELVISIDGGGDERAATVRLAQSFRWPHGPSKVMERDDLGLAAHFRACGDLVEELGPLVMLEDDLVVGPHALRYAGAALRHVQHDERIAGVCLSLPRFDGFRHLPFEPLLDGSAGVYAKLPWFHGMAWTPGQWRSHRGGENAPAVALPNAFDQLDGDEWFGDAVRSLISSDRWYLLARKAHAVNFGDVGVHFEAATNVFQRPLAGGRWTSPVFLDLDDEAVTPYDEYLEPDPRWLAGRIPALERLDVTFDLRAVRAPADIATDWVVTSRPSRRAVKQWGASMHPLEQNLLSDVAGECLSLCRVEDMTTGKRADLIAEQTVMHHGHHGRPPGLRAALRRRLLRLLAGRR